MFVITKKIREGNFAHSLTQDLVLFCRVWENKLIRQTKTL